MSRSAFNKTVDEGDDALIDAILQGWDGIKDEDGKDIPFTEKSKKEICDDHDVVKALISAYAESVVGAPVKNQKTPLSIGQQAVLLTSGNLTLRGLA